MPKPRKARMWIWFVLVVIVVIVIGLIAAFYVQPPKKEVIKIGFITPLTGPFAKWGESIKNGLDIALNDTKHKFEVNYQDDGCEPKNAVTIAHQFFDVENIKLVIGPGCIESLRPIAPIAEQKDALLFSTGLLDDAIFEEYPNNVINLATQISTEANYMAKYLDSQGVKRAAIVHGTNYFGQEFGTRLSEFLKEHDINVASIQPSALDTMDFRTIILKIMETNPEAICIHQGETQTGLFVKQLRELGYQTQVYGYYTTEQESVLQAGGDALNGTEYTYPFNSAEGSPKKQDFETRYTELYDNKIPSATSFFVYDGIMILDKAMDKCKPDDIKCIKGFFVEIGEYKGLSGNFRFEEDGSIFRPFGIKTIENREFKWVVRKIE